MENWHKIVFYLSAVPVMIVLGIALAWVPMLAWNHGIHSIFPSLPEIGYWQAFWLELGLNYLLVKPIVVKSHE